MEIPFRVSAGGVYFIRDAFESLRSYGGVAVNHEVYEGNFNPAEPRRNIKYRKPVNSYNLVAGVPYVLVVQQRCENTEGAWAMAGFGPGTITSEHVAAVPNFTRGEFTENDPTKPWHPGSVALTHYKQSGPVRIARSGTYFFSDLALDNLAQVSLHVYSAPVNPADPWDNFVGLARQGSPQISLKAGQDYYFVTQWAAGEVHGEYQYVLSPPAPFRINPGAGGSWHNPGTPGQGFFLTAYEKTNQVFLAWFTYANESHSGDEFGHRWMTAFGNFEGASAELAIEWTEGGRFDTATPAPEQYVDGTIELEFTDCMSGQITYNWGGSGDVPAASGVIPIQRLANDSVALCESLYAGPGMPGPL